MISPTKLTVRHRRCRPAMGETHAPFLSLRGPHGSSPWGEGPRQAPRQSLSQNLQHRDCSASLAMTTRASWRGRASLFLLSTSGSLASTVRVIVRLESAGADRDILLVLHPGGAASRRRLCPALDIGCCAVRSAGSASTHGSARSPVLTGTASTSHAKATSTCCREAGDAQQTGATAPSSCGTAGRFSTPGTSTSSLRRSPSDCGTSGPCRGAAASVCSTPAAGQVTILPVSQKRSAPGRRHSASTSRRPRRAWRRAGGPT